MFFCEPLSHVGLPNIYQRYFIIELAQCLFPASLHKIPVKLVKDEKI